jgi:hypothetical protein
VYTVIHTEPHEAAVRLADLGLEEEPLRTVIARGQLAVDSCTTNHPRLFPPLAGWAETVRALREYGATLGWTIADDSNYARTLDPTGRIAIVVATGNEYTGVANSTPSTKAAKGPNTVEAVLVNSGQMEMFPNPREAPEQHEHDDQRATWILLVYRGAGETRAELSLPVAIEDGRVTEWRERIILRPLTRDSETLTVEPPVQPDLDVQIRRRA